MLAFPFPYIANTTGWLTPNLAAAVGGLRTHADVDGVSPLVHPGTALLRSSGSRHLPRAGMLFVFLVLREVGHGPGSPAGAGPTGRTRDGVAMVELWYAIVAVM